MPTLIGRRNDGRELIERLQTRKAVRSIQEYRLVTCAGQKASLVDSIQQPNITGVTLNNLGRTNQLLYESFGTTVELTPQLEDDGTMMIDVTVSKSGIEDAHAVAIAQPKEGDAVYAATKAAVTLQTNVLLHSGEAMLVAQTRDSKKEKSELVILSAAVVAPRSAKQDE